jgi:metal-responsive CopG/Arc/MetJ family transcriptional regulator
MTISLPKELGTLLDARAAALGLSRSDYIRRVLRDDIEGGGTLVIRPRPPQPS